jgi:hypothetical protein
VGRAQASGSRVGTQIEQQELQIYGEESSDGRRKPWSLLTSHKCRMEGLAGVDALIMFDLAFARQGAKYADWTPGWTRCWCYQRVDMFASKKSPLLYVPSEIPHSRLVVCMSAPVAHHLHAPVVNWLVGPCS